MASMNALESEYSFLAPTWKLPPVATPSMYPFAHSDDPPDDADWTTWNNTRRNAGYIPSTVPRRANEGAMMSRTQPPGPTSRLRKPPSNNNNNNNKFHHSMDDFLTSFENDESHYSPPAPPAPAPASKRRVKIIDHRRTPSTDPQSDRESYQSYQPPAPPRPKPKTDSHSSPNKSKLHNAEPHSAHSTASRSTNGRVPEYSAAQSTQNPGSYVNSYISQQRRLQATKSEKAVMDEYKNFAQNGGFGPTFGGSDPQTYEEKRDFDKKRKEYAKQVREVNQYKIEEHRRYQLNGGQKPARGAARKYHSSEPARSHFLSAQEVREFERRIKREHAANCRCSLHSQSYLTSA